MDHKHTPEPWIVYQGRVYSADGPIATPHHRGLDGITHAERIVSCVNACEGIADPAEAIRETKEAITTFLLGVNYGAGETLTAMHRQRLLRALTLLRGG